MVKKVFPLLLSYVFVTTQCWAISGGPVYGKGRVNPTGTYSGVITGLTESSASSNQPAIPGDTLPTPDTATTTNSNALGLFDLSVPAIGTSSGAFLLFADGYVFGGTINASIDPDNDTLQGIVEGSYAFDVTTTTDIFGDVFTTGTATAQAIGMIKAQVTVPSRTSSVTARLAGTANLDVNFGQIDPTTLAPIIDRVITFTVTGFRQSTTAGASTSTLTTSTTTSSGT